MVPSKTWFGVFPAQELIRDRIRSCDMLVISIGGNDIALAPSICTIVAMVLLKLALNFRCVLYIFQSFAHARSHNVTGRHRLRMLTPWPLLFCFHPAVAYFIGLFRCQASCRWSIWLFHDIPWRFPFETTSKHFPVCRCNAMQTDWQQSPDPAKLVFAWSTIWTRGMVSSEAAAAYGNTSVIDTDRTVSTCFRNFTRSSRCLDSVLWDRGHPKVLG